MPRCSVVMAATETWVYGYRVQRRDVFTMSKEAVLASRGEKGSSPKHASGHRRTPQRPILLLASPDHNRLVLCRHIKSQTIDKRH